MKVSKGFTLVELLGVIALLGIVMLVSVPSLIESNKTSKETEKKEFENLVTEACETYLEVHSEDEDEDIRKLFDNKTAYSFSAAILVNEGYLKTSLDNPYNNKKVVDDTSVNLIATNDEGLITCEYQE